MSGLQPSEPASTAVIFDEDHPPRGDEASALLRDCSDRFVDLVVNAVSGSIEGTDDLFETTRDLPDSDVQDFRSGRGEWLECFARKLRELVERRIGGSRRKGRRPDPDVSAATLRVLSAFDTEMQAAVARAARALQIAARRELHALNQRVGLLLAEKAWVEPDNPFGTDYIVDSIGATSRSVYSNPRVWRPLMERVLVDIQPAVVKTSITLNRYLADRGVMPEIKAALRARSELRPADDSDLLPLFEHMMAGIEAPSAAAGDAAVDIAVPAVEEIAGDQPALVFVEHPAPTRDLSPGAPPFPAGARGAAEALYAAFARFVQRNPGAASPTPALTATPAESDALVFPELDSMMALGLSRDVIAELDRWQRFDPEHEQDSPAAPGSASDATDIPLNRLPLIRDAIAGRIANPADRMTMDVVALIFDYVFRDPSIPDSQRRIFARLQVPIAKAALLDHGFFSNRRHPARLLLDHLAAAAIGANGDPEYQQRFTTLARDVVDTIAAGFHLDIGSFEAADARIRPFVEGEQRTAALALREDIGAALDAEQREAGRTRVRALLRDRLAGLDVPFEVRSFTETLWSDHLTAIVASEGTDSDAWRAAVATLDDLLWSIAVKKRAAQKARLTRMIPSLVRRLRAGVGTEQGSEARFRGFVESLYKLHIAVLRPDEQAPRHAAEPAGDRASTAPVAARATDATADATADAAGAPAAVGERKAFDPASVHDYVSEMPIGTWLRFDTDDGAMPARLFWVSPMRTRYVFTTRGHGRALSLAPEELAWQLGTGKAALIVEPVPIFDRAVSAALDTLAARLPKPRSAAH